MAAMGANARDLAREVSLSLSGSNMPPAGKERGGGSSTGLAGLNIREIGGRETPAASNQIPYGRGRPTSILHAGCAVRAPGQPTKSSHKGKLRSAQRDIDIIGQSTLAPIML